MAHNLLDYLVLFMQNANPFSPLVYYNGKTLAVEAVDNGSGWFRPRIVVSDEALIAMSNEEYKAYIGAYTCHWMTYWPGCCISMPTKQSAFINLEKQNNTTSS